MQTRSAKRRTLGFLFTDLRGYTQLIDASGDAAAANIVRDYRALARAAIAEHEGREVGTEGDSFFVVFDSVGSAVECAIDILKSAGANDPAIAVGAGVHAGEAADGDLGYVAGGVNLAARLCALARAGEILVSDTVRALTRMAVEVRYESAGSRRLKGFEEPVSVWRIEVAGAARTSDHGLPPRWLAVAMAFALAAAVAMGVYQDGVVLGYWSDPKHSLTDSIPAVLLPVLAGFNVVYLVSGLVVGLAIVARSPSWARLATRLFALNAVMTATVIPLYVFVTGTAQSGVTGGFFLVFAVLSVACYLGTAYGFYRRARWVVGVGYVTCALFLPAVTTLPIGLAAAWAIRTRRENAFY